MNLEINDKVYTFKFGTKFIRELDKRFPVKRDGYQMNFGAALAMNVIPALSLFSTNMLAHVLVIATQTEDLKLTLDEADNYIDGSEDIEEVFEKVQKAIEESNAGKLVLRTVMSNVEQAENEILQQ